MVERLISKATSGNVNFHDTEVEGFLVVYQFSKTLPDGSAFATVRPEEHPDMIIGAAVVDNADVNQSFLEKLGILILVCIIGVCASIPVAVSISQSDRPEWDVFAIENKCSVIGNERGFKTYVPVTKVEHDGSKSVSYMYSYTPGRTEFQCDDGKTYWR